MLHSFDKDHEVCAALARRERTIHPRSNTPRRILGVDAASTRATEDDRIGRHMIYIRIAGGVRPRRERKIDKCRKENGNGTRR
jgi:hypothetical protein